MKNIGFAILLKMFIFLGVFSLSVFSQTSEQPKNNGQNQKSQVDSKSSSDLNLENTNWRLIKIKSYKMPELERPVLVRFNNKNQTFTSSNLCNEVRGNYKTVSEKNGLAITLKMPTLIGCDPENEVEDALSKSLKIVNRYEIVDENLYLYRGKNLLITLTNKKEK